MPKQGSRLGAALAATMREHSTTEQADLPTKKAAAQAGRIMYIECKGGGLTGPGRIGRVQFSQTGLTLYYKGERFKRLKGFKANYYNVETNEKYWISGPKRRGGDALYATNIPTAIDEDVREEYWREIRRMPENIELTGTL